MKIHNEPELEAVYAALACLPGKRGLVSDVSRARKIPAGTARFYLVRLFQAGRIGRSADKGTYFIEKEES